MSVPEDDRTMSPLRDKRPDIRAYTMTITLMLPVVALAVHLVTHFGRGVDVRFYEVSAQVIPTLLIASAVLINDLRMAGGDDLGLGVLVSFVVTSAGAAEVPSLIAIALGGSSTFLFVWAALGLAHQFFLLKATFEAGTTPESH
jgi:hypothetical protein